MNRKPIIVMLLSILLGSSTLKADFQIIIKRLNQPNLIELASNLGPTTFEDGNMVLRDMSNEVIAKVPLSEETKFVVDNQPTDVNTIQTTKAIQIYPNTAQDIVYIAGVSTNDNILIYSMSGNLMASILVSENPMPVYIGNFAVGTYLLMINNVPYKMIKK
ncbi:MAG: T9SS type A sorting domain-containing protein [Paludibacteraceae bacterium]|nr:T9SS type A sorting domain-containing protein [Paludibacteraceae bacterium]